MRIKIGDKFGDYVNVSYVVKKYENKIITFEVDNGNMKDEVYSKDMFVNLINGNRFHKIKDNEKNSRN